MSAPAEWDIRHRAGDTLEQGFRLNFVNAVTGQGTPADLTGWVPSVTLANARTKAPVAGLSVSLGNQATDPGVLTVHAAPEATAGWTAGPSLLFEVIITETATAFVRTVLAGRIVVEV